MGDYHDEPVLILKTSQGNRSLAWDFLPPGSERYEVGDKVYAGYKDSPAKLGQGHQARADQLVRRQAVRRLLRRCERGAGQLRPEVPALERSRLRDRRLRLVAGPQGHGRMRSTPSRYEQNLVHLIKTLRKEFEAPDAPFVIATIGFDGWKMEGNTQDRRQRPARRQRRQGQVSRVQGQREDGRDARLLASAEESPKNQGYHYNQNAETYMTRRRGDGQGNARTTQVERVADTLRVFPEYLPVSDCPSNLKGKRLVRLPVAFLLVFTSLVSSAARRRQKATQGLHSRRPVQHGGARESRDLRLHR